MAAHRFESPKDIAVRIEIERPLLLPKIEKMGEEKKLKEIVKEKQLQIEPEPKPHLKNEKVTKKQELKKQAGKTVLKKKIAEKTEQNPLQESVKVINPQEEAMFRYQDMVKQKIESYRRYPNWAKKQGFEGTVYLTFVIMPDGQARNVKIVHSSGFNILDQETVSTIKRASPFPPVPQDVNAHFVQMEVSVVFTLR